MDGRRATLLFLLIAAVAAAGCWIEQRPGAEESEGADTAASSPNLWSRFSTHLDSSALAWNRGDLEGFLSTYRQAPTTTYIGASGLVVGFQRIRGRYAPLFGQGAERDSLRFEDLRIRPLGDSTALAIGRYVLHRADSVTSIGIFTLVLQESDGRWMIVHDHSSALEPPER